MVIDEKVEFRYRRHSIEGVKIWTTDRLFRMTGAKNWQDPYAGNEYGKGGLTPQIDNTHYETGAPQW